MSGYSSHDSGARKHPIGFQSTTPRQVIYETVHRVRESRLGDDRGGLSRARSLMILRDARRKNAMSALFNVNSYSSLRDIHKYPKKKLIDTPSTRRKLMYTQNIKDYDPNAFVNSMSLEKSLKSIKSAPIMERNRVPIEYYSPRLHEPTMGPGDYFAPIEKWTVTIPTADKFPISKRGADDRWIIGPEKMNLCSTDLRVKHFSEKNFNRKFDWYSALEEKGVKIPPIEALDAPVPEQRKVHQWKFTSAGRKFISPGPGEYGAWLPDRYGKNVDIQKEANNTLNLRYGYKPKSNCVPLRMNDRYENLIHKKRATTI